MVVTEFALLHLAPGVDISQEDIRGKLKHAKIISEDFTKRNFYLFQQVEDSSYLYIIGEWDSVEQHVNDFIPGAENQAVLETVKDDLTVPWLIYLDVSHADLPVPKSEAEKQKALQGDLVWSIVRYHVKEGERQKFQESFDANGHLLQDFVTEGKVGGGWRVNKEEGKEERVSFCPWKSVQQHQEFAATEEFKQYVVIKEHLESTEIKHARLVDLWS